MLTKSKSFLYIVLALAAGVALLLAGEWRWGAGALAGGAVLYPLFDVLERRCRPRARYETDERGHARPKYK